MNTIQLALRNLKGKPLRSIALILIIAFLSFSVFAGSMIVSSLQLGLSNLQQRLGADIIVVPYEAKSKTDLSEIMLQGNPGYFYMDRSYIDKVRAVKGVESVSPQFFLASAKAACCSARVQIIGFDPETDFSIQPWIAKSYSRDLGDNEIIVGSDIVVPDDNRMMFYGTLVDVVAQLDRTGTYMDTSVYCNVSTIRTLIRSSLEVKLNKFDVDPDQVISTIMIKVKDGYDIEDVTNYINVHIRKVEAVQARSLLSNVSSSLNGISAVISILIAIIWIQSLLIMIIAFLMISNERKKEFAILRVLGSSRKKLAGIVLSEAGFLGFLGGILGVGAAALALIPISGLISGALGLPFVTPDGGITAMLVIGSLLVAVFTGPLTAGISALRISRIDTGLILREGE